MPTDMDITITELEEFEPSRVDGVGKGANGFPILMLKGIEGEVIETETTIEAVLEDLDKSDSTDSDDKCDVCGGEGLIKATESKCSKCRGTGLMPKIGMSEDELAEAAKASHGAAPSGTHVPVTNDCPTCHGGGTIKGDGTHDGIQCPDCDGTGEDNTLPPADKLSRVDGDGHHIHVGDTKGREAVDKSVELCEYSDCEICKEAWGEDFEKAKLDAKGRDALPGSAFALPDRRYPIHDESHARNALARVAENGTSEEKAKVRAAVKSRYPDIEVTAKAMDGTIFTGSNPSSDGSSDDSDDAAAPGTPAWEAVDAQIAHDAALALKTAGELIRKFAQREAVEVAVGEGNDIFDTMEAESAMAGVAHALGIMAQMAFHEGLEAAKSLDDDEAVEKAGKRLSTKSVSALAAARDHISQLLGDDDPAKADKNEKTDGGKSAADKFIEHANKAVLAKEIENMSTDELTKMLDEREERLVELIAEALKGKPAAMQADSVSNAKTANGKAKAKKPKEEDKDLEDEADQGDHDSANTSPSGAAKAVEDMTPEEIAAKEMMDEAIAMKKEAKKAQKQAAQDAAVAKEIKEGIEEATKAYESLQERLGNVDELRNRLATVEKMSAPVEDSPVRVAPVEDLTKAPRQIVIENEVARLEGLARNEANREIRKAYEDRANDERAKLATLEV